MLSAAALLTHPLERREAFRPATDGRGTTMRYLAATTLMSLFAFTAVARADHDIRELSCAYRDTVRELTDHVNHDRYASRYVKSYVSRLDRAACAFHEAVALDPNCHRIEAMFDDMCSLHHRVERLVVSSCRTDRHLRAIWYDASHYLQDLAALIRQVHHYGQPVIQRRITVSKPVIAAPVIRQPIVTQPRSGISFSYNYNQRVPNIVPHPRQTTSVQRTESQRYQLDQQRARHQSINNRNLNNRNLDRSRSSSDLVGRMLTGLFN